MRQSLLLWQSKVNALAVRERGLLLLASIAVLYLLWDGLLQGHLDRDTARLKSIINERQTELKALKTEELTLNLLVNIDPDATKKRKIESLKSEINALDEALSELSHGLVGAGNLAKVLEDVLLQGTSLKLLKVKTLPVQALELSIANVESGVADNDGAILATGAGVYKHSVVVEVEGEYFELLAYLESLEQLPWRFYWDQLNYQVSNYPNAVIEVRVYTLSAEEGLIGV